MRVFFLEYLRLGVFFEEGLRGSFEWVERLEIEATELGRSLLL